MQPMQTITININRIAIDVRKVMFTNAQKPDIAEWLYYEQYNKQETIYYD